MELKIRNSTFEVLFDHVLSLNYVYDWGVVGEQDWECHKTDDKAKNPLVIFKTKKWSRLIELCNEYIEGSKNWSDKQKEDMLDSVGAIKGFIHNYEMKKKYGR